VLHVVIREGYRPPGESCDYLYELRVPRFIHFSSFQRTGDPGRAPDGKDCSVSKKAARGFRLFLMGVAIASVALAGGCGGSPEGTSVEFKPEADKTRQDAMREGMMKLKGGAPGTGAKAKAK